MRRSLAAFAASVLLLSRVGGAVLGAGPGSSGSLAPIVERVPSAGALTTGASKVHRARAATDPTDRWIVVLKPGTDVTSAVARQGKRIGFATDRTFRNAVRGYSAVLDRSQVSALSHDPSVAMIVADEKIEAEAQSMPTGVRRVGAPESTVAAIDGLDERVDADVAIVDTGIASVADLNVVGGYNCSTTNRAAWRDVYGHGTHVAGTVGAIDNGSGVVGVAPGVRLWAVKILDDTGTGLLSWYVCGLDWIAGQRDPSDPARPLFEVANMSVAKYGKDDATCGTTAHDILHAAICRLVSGGVTVVAAAGNDSGNAAARVPAAYNQVITVSALADTDGKPGGLGGHRCYSWGSYDSDDTFANFSNYGPDVDLIAPGKCIWSTIPGGYQYMSGTSMAAPHVTGAVALLKASRPDMTPAEVREALIYLGSQNWKTSTDPDTTHEPLLDVSRIGPRGDFSITADADPGAATLVAIAIDRSPTSFERIQLSATGLPDNAGASFSPSSLYGFGPATATLRVAVPLGAPLGSYPITVVATEHGIVHTVAATIEVTAAVPVASPPTVAVQTGVIFATTAAPIVVSWPAATDAASTIAGYELQTSRDGAAFGATIATAPTVRSRVLTQTIGHRYAYRVRARDSVGNWSAWATGPSSTPGVIQDRAASVSYTASWRRLLYSNASGGSTTYSYTAGARARTSFIGRVVALVAPFGTSRGSARIYVDGAYRTTISLRASANRSRIVAWATTFTKVATHSIEIRLIGNGRVDIDAFVILR